MIGTVLVIIVVAILIPMSVLIMGGAAAPVVGWFLKSDAEQRYEGSELLETNV